MCVQGLFISCEVKAKKFESDPWKQASSLQEVAGIGMVVASFEQFKEALSDHYVYLNEKDQNG